MGTQDSEVTRRDPSLEGLRPREQTSERLLSPDRPDPLAEVLAALAAMETAKNAVATIAIFKEREAAALRARQAKP